MATMRGESGETKPKVDSLIDQVDKNRREMSETRMYAKLILSAVRRLGEEVAALIGKCSDPEASPSEEVEVIDLEEEGGNSGGTNQDQRGHQRGGNDDLGQFKRGMRKDCGRLRDKVDNVVTLAQLLTNHATGLDDPKLILNRVSTASSSRPASNDDGRRSPTSDVGLVITGSPKDRAENGALSPSSLGSAGQDGFTAGLGLEGVSEGRISTTADSRDMTVGGDQISTGALRKKRLRCRNSSVVSVVAANVPQETEESSIHAAEAIDPDDDSRPGSKARDNQLRRSRRISSKPDMGDPKENRTTRITSTPRGAKAPPNQPEVGNRTRVDAESTTGTGFDAIAASDVTPTVPSPKPGPSTQTQELLSSTGYTSQMQTGVNADPLPNMAIESQPVSATDAAAAASSSNKLSPSLECVFCHRNFGTKWTLENHTLSHIGERPHFCKLCPYESSRKVNLITHLETHKSFRERRFQCPLCQKRFRTQNILKRHNRGVHDKKRPFKCEACPRAFAFKCSLKMHMLVHTGEKNHSCGICDKKFVRKKNLDDHIRLHTGESPKCRFCGKSFTSSDAHWAHERMHQRQQ